jgi:hypothetical protein
MRGVVVCIVGASLVAAHAQQLLQAGGSGYFGIGVNWVMAQERRNLQRSGASRVVQQQQPTGAEASAASTGTVPAPAAQGTTGAGKQQTPLRQQLQVASGALHAQQLAIESTTKPVPVPEPVGAQIESSLPQVPNYAETLRNLIKQRLSMPLPQHFSLWASVPTTSGLEAWGLLRQALQFLKDRLPQLSQQDAQLVSALSNDENLESALWQEAWRLLEEELVLSPVAGYYLKLVETLKKQEEKLRKELLQIPEDQRVMANQRFVDLYNRYLQLQSNIMNVGALAAADYGLRINWQNLLDRAAANFLQPVWNILQRQGLKVPVEQAIEGALRNLWSMAEDSDNPHLQKALQYLEEIRKYGGQNLTLWDSARIAQLHSEYVTALKQAGLDPKTVNALASVVTKLGTLPGLGWSSGPIIEGPR